MMKKKVLAILLTALLLCLLPQAVLASEPENPLTLQAPAVSSPTWYAMVLYDSGDESYKDHLLSFTMDDLSTVNDLGFHLENIYAAEYYNGYIYEAKMEDDKAVSFWRISFDGETLGVHEKLSDDIGYILGDMAYDYATDTMYAVGYDGSRSWLVTIDLVRGIATPVAAYSGADEEIPILAIDKDGSAYGISDDSGKFYRIDLKTAAATYVGETGVKVDYLQTMAFDHDSGDLYWAQIDSSNSNNIYKVDPTTGVVTKVGQLLGHRIGLVGLFTIPTISSISLSTDPATTPAALDFGSATAPYTQPATQTVTITNTGNQAVTLNQPTAKNYTVGTLSTTSLPKNGSTTTFTLQPKAGLLPGNYDETVTVSGSNSVSAELSASFTVTQGENPFSDVDTGAWFFDDVMFVFQKDLMVGTSDTTFQPQSLSTRAMAAVVLWRLAGEPAATVASGFTDVPDNQYYTDAVAWAAQNHIVAGFTPTIFAPNAPVTREQLVVFFYRYAQYCQADIALSDNLDKFTDKTEVSPWAEAAMQWAVDNGILVGKTTNILAPGSDATRAEFAAMFHRFLGKV